MLTCFFLIGISACDKQDEQHNNINTTSNTPNLSIQAQEEPNQNIIIENKSYLFDITNHSLPELEALLERAEEVSQTQSPEYKDLEIVMIIHGPDIEWFRQQNYAENKKLIDLAARLDKYDIIDMQVCERTLKYHGVEREEIPEFIESVPYAPIEIENRLRDGYINL